MGNDSGGVGQCCWLTGLRPLLFLLFVFGAVLDRRGAWA